MRDKYKDYTIIILYGIILLTVLMGFFVFGSTKDWLNQHIVFPEYYRDIFYSTGKLLPEFSFNLGAGQNMFNLAYYGLMSPIILLSYLLPFISMKVFIIIAGIILYLLSGIFMYKFIDNNFHNRKYSLYSGLLYMTLPILTYHFHHHIMFVFYIPFLILSLIEVDNYIDNNRSFKLMLFILIIILINYYYSVGALITIFIYYIYKLLLHNKFTFKYLFRMISIFIIPIMISSFLLLPVGYTILNAHRFINNASQEVNLINLFVINFKELFYSTFSLGLSGIFFIALFGNIYNKHKSVSNYFLNISLLVLLIPIFMYILNGMLYIRGKSLIPFSILYIYSFILFIKNIKSIDYIRLNKTIIISLIIIFIFNIKSISYILEILFVGYLLEKYIHDKKKYKKLFFGYVLFISLFFSFYFNYYGENHITYNFNNKYNVDNKSIDKLLSNIDNKYRVDIIYNSRDLVNKIYNDKHLSNSMYSSTYNYDYSDFYNNFGNNILFRNNLMFTGSNNELFYTFMGSKYIVDSNNKFLYYKKIKSDKDLSLYYNKSAYPLVYTSKNIGSSKTYNSLQFPYNMEYIMNNTVIKDDIDIEYDSKITKYKDNNIKKRYKFTFDEITHKSIRLNNVKGKMLYISFDMNYNDDYKDSYIIINGVQNTLTCKRWRYYNNNTNFKYVLYMDSNILDIEFSDGIFDIDNVNIYYSDKIINNYKEIDNLKLDYSNSTITGNYLNKSSDKYLVTSIPYDDGFRGYINDKRVDIVKVNKSFVGLRLNPGMNNIKIEYKAPWYFEGCIISLFGLFILLFKMILEFVDNRIINKGLFKFIK